MLYLGQKALRLAWLLIVLPVQRRYSGGGHEAALFSLSEKDLECFTGSVGQLSVDERGEWAEGDSRPNLCLTGDGRGDS